MTSFDNQLATSLLTTCKRVVADKLSQGMATHPGYRLVDNKSMRRYQQTEIACFGLCTQILLFLTHFLNKFATISQLDHIALERLLYTFPENFLTEKQDKFISRTYLISVETCKLKDLQIESNFSEIQTSLAELFYKQKMENTKNLTLTHVPASVGSPNNLLKTSLKSQTGNEKIY